jgi:hypothetical protein
MNEKLPENIIMQREFENILNLILSLDNVIFEQKSSACPYDGRR